MTIPASARFDVAHRFYRAVWGRREGTVVFVNATRLWFLDLEVGVGYPQVPEHHG